MLVEYNYLLWVSVFLLSDDSTRFLRRQLLTSHLHLMFESSILSFDLLQLLTQLLVSDILDEWQIREIRRTYIALQLYIIKSSS